MNKIPSDTTEINSEETNSGTSSDTSFNDSKYLNLNILRTDHELFKEEDNIKQKVINVKRIKLPRDGEDWEILEDEKVILTLKGTRFSKRQREFLRSVNGMKFLMNGYKSGIKSVVKFKSSMLAMKIK
jgi:hypothetical protein